MFVLGESAVAGVSSESSPDAAVIAHARESALEVELSTWAFNEPAHAAFARVGFQPMLVRYELTPRG